MMWPFGVLALIAVSVGTGQLLARRGGVAPARSLWDLPRTTSTFTSIVGMLSGFTVVVTMFFANLTVARDSPEFEAVIGMLLLAFLMFVASAMQFGTTPNLAGVEDENYLSLQRLSYVLANLSYFCAIASSWLSLRLFLLAIGMPYLAGVFTWVLFFSAFSGSLRMALFTYRMSTLGKAACVAVPFLAFGLSAVYRLVVARYFPDLVPTRAEPFFMAICVFVLGALGFTWQTTTIMLTDTEGNPPSPSRKIDRLQLAYLQAVSTTVALMWLTVALA